MLKAIVLTGCTKEMKSFWVESTQKKRRVFLNGEVKEGEGFLIKKAQVFLLREGKITKKLPPFCFVVLHSLEKISEAMEETRILLKEKKPIGKEEILLLLSRKDHALMKKVCPEKFSKRYHYKEQHGWIMILKGKVRHQDVNELVGKFFKEEMIGSEAKYEELDEALFYAKKKNFKRMSPNS